MRDLVILLVHLITIILKLARGVRAVVAESRSCQTSITDPQPFASACGDSPRPGSAQRRILFLWIKPNRLRFEEKLQACRFPL
jgi:hypothetical protein